MATHTFDAAAFRTMFPMFASTTIYPDATLSMWWTMATCAMSPDDNCVIRADCLQTALYLMTAHIGMTLTQIACGGNTATGVLTSATIDKVSVSYQPPPFKTGWQAWLARTPFGQQLWALLSAKAVGGFYIGGRPELSAFRKVGGVF